MYFGLSLFPLLCENGVLIAFYILGLISLKVLINGLLFVLHVDSLLEK